MKEVNNLYYQIRRTQHRLVRLQYYKPGELWEIYNRKTVNEYARKLTDKYFFKTKKMSIYRDIIKLYKVLIIMSPILQKLKYSFKIDMHRGHFVTYVRKCANGRVKRFWYSSSSLKREYDHDKLRINILNIGIKDNRFAEEMEELFRFYYNSDGMKGRLANIIYDPIMFMKEGKGNRIRIGNEIFRFEKSRHPSAVNLSRKHITAWDYKIKYIKKNNQGHVEVQINDNIIETYMFKVKSIVKSRATSNHKIAMIKNKINDLLETAKYANSALNQILGLMKWTNKKTKNLIESSENKKRLGLYMLDSYSLKVTRKFYINRLNIFWSDNLTVPDDKVYMNFYSPYRVLLPIPAESTVGSLNKFT